MTTTPTVWREGFTVNADALGGSQFEPKVLGLANGNILVAWTDRANNVDTAPGTDIIGRLLDPLGNPIGDFIHLNAASVDANDEGGFELAALPGGGFILVHETTVAGDGTTWIYAQEFTDAGASVGFRVIESDAGADDHGSPAVSVNFDRSYIVAYQSATASDTALSSLWVDTGGTLSHDYFNSPEPMVGNQNVAIASLSNGNHVIVSGYERVPDDALSFQIVDDQGVATGFPGWVNLTNVNERHDRDADVAALTVGGFVVTWVVGEGDDRDIVMQRYDNGGVAQGMFYENLANTGGVDTNANPAALALPDGGFVIMWQESVSQNLAGFRFDATGVVISEKFLVDSFEPTWLTDQPDLAVLADGRLAVVFENQEGIELAILDSREATINGGGGDDGLTGRQDGSTLSGGAGNDRIWGVGGDDVVDAGTGHDTVDGGGGNDELNGGLLNDTLSGGPGIDRLNGESGVDFLYGDDDGDLLNGGAGVDALRGGGGNDQLEGGTGGDLMIGATGDDFYTVDDPGDVVVEFFDEGIDTISSAITYSLQGSSSNPREVEHLFLTGATDIGATGNGLANHIVGNSGANTIDGGNGGDLLQGNDGDDMVDGDAGDDLLEGGAGDDSLDGSFGSDTLLGGAGNDWLSGGNGETGTNTVMGEAGNDVIIAGGVDSILNGGTDNDLFYAIQGEHTINGGAGLDTLDYDTEAIFGIPYPDAPPIVVTLNGASDASVLIGGVAKDTIRDVENVFGLSGDDKITGDAADNILRGRDGIDVLEGHDGVDTLFGDGGDDLLNGGLGADYHLGGAGDDLYLVDDTFDLVDEGGAYPTFPGDALDFDTIVSTADWFWDVYSVAESIEIADRVVASPGVTVVASVFSNFLTGNDGTNILFGRGGSDTYIAGDGIDWISLSLLGTDGAYPGVDGVNTVIVEQRASGPTSYDIVYEFESGKDKLNVSDYAAVNGLSTGADVLARGVDDGAGNCFFILGDGFDYLYMIGLEVADIATGDFVVT